MNGIILAELVLYCLVIAALGYRYGRREMSHSDFLLGGKKLPGWALAFSERATGESAWLLLGYTGFVFASGLSAIWVAVGIVIGIVCAWLFLADRFRQEAERHGALTLPGYLAKRFGAHGRTILWLSTVLIFSFMMFYFSAQIAGAGKTLFAVFHIDPKLGMVISVAIVIILSYTGGFVSVVWTDMIQSVLMLATLVILPIVALVEIYSGGLSISAALHQAKPGLDSWTGGAAGFALGLLLFNNFAWFFGYLGGQPQLSVRFMALKDTREAKTAKTVAIIWTLLAYGGAFLIGLAALALYQNQSFADVETVLPHMALDLLPPWLAGVLLSGILAAIVTTADSQQLVITSSISEDIVRRSLRLCLSERQLVALSRAVVVIAGLLGLVLAMTSETLVYFIVSWAWAGIGCTLSPVILLSFFWKRYSGIGAIATIVAGFVSTVIWISSPLEAIISSRFTTFAIALIAGVLFSLLFPDRQQAR
ncbi:sodium/proline symporter [Geobacillus sp. LEMMY01]|uniref:sodium/proline symporter n=1 Tax=Geobacillus sp. LEMMY01 TaxID=1954237 RepID=UPI0009AC9421|nr:sodium/proline symporter [Geobacillus sp. LEMMY01]OPX04679.1 sodium:proline symporter [Geobacillus sp. LEMMY01]